MKNQNLKQCFIALSVILLIFFSCLVSKEAYSNEYVKPSPDIVQFSSSGEHTYAIDDQGKLLAWGRNEDGELGSEDGINRSVPSPVVSMSSDTFKQVTTGRFGSLAIKTDGTVVSWQSKKNQGRSIAPKTFSSLKNVVKIAAGGDHFLALDQSGQVWGWGDNSRGQLANFKSSFINEPTLIKDLPMNIVGIAATNQGSFALSKDGTLLYWGGDNEDANIKEPQLLKQLKKIKMIKSGDFAISAIDMNGNGWTYNPLESKTKQFKIPQKLKDISAQFDHTVSFVTTTGDVWISAGNSNPEKVKGLANISEVNSGNDFTIVRTENNKLWSWGSNVNGQLGIDSTLKNVKQPTIVVKPIQLTVDGSIMDLTTTPKLLNGSVYVPFRGIFEKSGAKVIWNNSQRNHVTITKGKLTIELVVNQKFALVNGKKVSLAAPPKYINGSILVPIRFISQTLGAKVNWNASKYEVTVNNQ
ncbi:hypothetical protein GMA19_04100 [Paenibacillus polymyxa E681]|uniref:RCC1 domain-containing protein n=1 Tax=Paenibacillus polymyxa TaxID=1406 RepID=UPI0001E31D86|nr:stalk domain-containing protein [Paenibacillus polymyxa]ADM71870.1 hypothetical protein PPE_04090 [Paenibacillus polymyxa E681]QNV58895.1 hypothetical protein GE561_04102 [Paenibacillus polymyxa E681]QNV63730.1 hypothetical protein GMA19_04100 [Paenibacillus polymyxa E681]